MMGTEGARARIALGKRSHLKSANAGANDACTKPTRVRSVQSLKAPHDTNQAKRWLWGVHLALCLPQAHQTHYCNGVGKTDELRG